MRVLVTYIMYTSHELKFAGCMFTLPLIKIMNYVVVLYKQCTRINYQREVIMNSICEMYGIFISLYRLNVKHGNGIRIFFNLHILSVKNYKKTI